MHTKVHAKTKPPRTSSARLGTAAGPQIKQRLPPPSPSPNPHHQTNPHLPEAHTTVVWFATASCTPTLTQRSPRHAHTPICWERERARKVMIKACARMPTERQPREAAQRGSLPECAGHRTLPTPCTPPRSGASGRSPVKFKPRRPSTASRATAWATALLGTPSPFQHTRGTNQGPPTELDISYREIR